MSSRSESEDEMFDDLVDQYRRHLRGRGPIPDLSDATVDLRRDLDQTFGVLAAITGMSRDVVPPLEDDPLTAALGLGPAVDGVAEFPPRATDASTALVEELETFAVADAMLEFGDGARPDETLSVVAVYRHWGSVVRVCLIDGGLGELVERKTMSAIRSVFVDRPDTTLVAAVVYDDELSCIVASPQDCVDAIDPQVGAVGPRGNMPVLPVGMALARCFEFTNPAWDDVLLTPFEVESFDVVAGAAAAAELALSSVLTQSRRMPEKALALESLGVPERSWLAGLAGMVSEADFDLDAALDQLAEAHA